MAEEDVPMRSLLFSTLSIVCIWMSTFTVFMPLFILLVLFKSLRAKFFSFMYANVIVHLCPRRNELREKLFKVLEEHLSSEKQVEPLRFLEIGVADGLNFPYYPKDCSLTLLDVNPNFEQYITSKLKKFPNLNIKNILIAPAEDMKGVEDNSFDVVISTHCLCSVSDVNLVLKEVHRVLKPGGKYAFFDHVAFKGNRLVYLLQKFCNLLWKIYMNGCCLDRDVESMVVKNFRDVSAFTSYPSFMPLFLRAHLFVIASK